MLKFLRGALRTIVARLFVAKRKSLWFWSDSHEKYRM